MAKIDADKVSKIVKMIRSGKNQPLWSTGSKASRAPSNTKVYSQAEIDEMNRVNQQAGDMAYDIDGMNNLSDGTFLDIFPRYQENFQFSGKRKGPYGEGEYPSNFRVRRDPDGYRSDAAMTYREKPLMQHDIPKYDKPDVARLNSYGNGEFIDSQGLLSDKPTYVRSNSYPNDEYLMAPKRKIDQSLKAGDMNLKQMNGELFGSNEDWWKTIGLDELD